LVELLSLNVKKIFILNLISIFSLLSYATPSTAISNDDSNQTSDAAVWSEQVFYKNLPAALTTLPFVAGINHPHSGRDTYETKEFTLKNNSILHLYATVPRCLNTEV